MFTQQADCDEIRDFGTPAARMDTATARGILFTFTSYGVWSERIGLARVHKGSGAPLQRRRSMRETEHEHVVVVVVVVRRMALPVGQIAVGQAR